ncbi:MAG TPA: hypothetical protein EYP19_15700 [Desulfobacterales bacterium]|nr:hypothetical protein [Desulfobacterales bacterium]
MTFRALIIGTLLSALTVYIVSYAELLTQVIMIGFLQLPPVVVALMFGLVLINKLLERVNKRYVLGPAEITVAFSMMLVASVVSSRGLWSGYRQY